MNVGFSSFTALSKLDTHAWLKSSEGAMSVTRRVMREIMTVAEKEGVRVREGYVEELLEQVCHSSLLFIVLWCGVFGNRFFCHAR